MIAPFEFHENQLKQLNDTLKSASLMPLTESEALLLKEEVEYWRHRREIARYAERSTRRDQMRTLKHLSELRDEAELLMAFSRCDAETENQIILALYRGGARTLHDLSPSQVQIGARNALEKLGPLAGLPGRPSDDYLPSFVSFCLAQWCAQGGAIDAPSWVSENAKGETKSSPLRRWVNTLINCLEGRSLDEKKTRSLIKNAKGKVFSPMI